MNLKMCECALYTLRNEFSQPVTQQPFKTPIFQIQWRRQHTHKLLGAQPVQFGDSCRYTVSFRIVIAAFRNLQKKHRRSAFSAATATRAKGAAPCSFVALRRRHAIYCGAICHILVVGVYVRHSPDILCVEPHPLDLHFHSVSHVIACTHTYTE